MVVEAEPNKQWAHRLEVEGIGRYGDKWQRRWQRRT
jgi:hypothetical protein